MNETAEKFLVRFPIERAWLDDIIDFLLQEPKGIASKEKISLGLANSHNHVRALKETVESAIGPRCKGVQKLDTSQTPIFELIEPGVVRLLNYPDRPQTSSENDFKFVDVTAQFRYGCFIELLKKKKAIEAWKKKKWREKIEWLAANERFIADI